MQHKQRGPRGSKAHKVSASKRGARLIDAKNRGMEFILGFFSVKKPA